MALNRTEQGMWLMIAGMLIIPGIDAFAKSLSDTVAAGQISMSRFMFQTLLMLPFILVRGTSFNSKGVGWSTRAWPVSRVNRVRIVRKSTGPSGKSWKRDSKNPALTLTSAQEMSL